MARSSGETVSIGGHRLRLTHLDKVLYPETGTTKADVIRYYVEIAPYMLPHVADRAATRKRWVDGVGTADKPGQVFFEKNLPDSAPSWIRRASIQHKTSRNSYVVIDSEAVLAWLGQMAALEIHVPQWRVGPHGKQLNPDRFVLDLDPGPGAGLPECVEVAKKARKMLSDLGLDAYPVTSGSKGIHLYAGLDGSHDADYVNAFAKQFAEALESELPDLVVSTQKKSLRGGKVLADWSQNNKAKTTIAPYSLRGRLEPTVAVPRTWKELNDPDLRHLTYDEVLERMKRRKDPLAPLGRESAGGEVRTDKLTLYRSKRDASKTPEPVPEESPLPGDGNAFVIQEHHASRLHWDFRLEHDGVLVSWALPKGVPTDPKQNHLAVQTEDHPLEYGTFEGTIPKGEYGGGEVTIWDTGTYELEKWRRNEVIVTLTGRPGGGLGKPRRLALIKTGENWLIHLMKDQGTVKPSTPPPAAKGEAIKPMLASAGDAVDVDDGNDWAFEMKWDGYRAIAVCDGDAVTLYSRSGKNMSADYPGVATALAAKNLPDTVLDGEVVAIGPNGAPSFGRLQNGQEPIRYFVFDVLRHDGTGFMNDPYTERRDVLAGIDLESDAVKVPVAFEGSLEDAIESSKELGLEGVVAKRLESRYRSGTRSSSWIKIKHQRMQEVVIVGWRPGKGNRQGAIGSLLLAVPGDDGLVYAGRVGTGFSAKILDDLAAKLQPLERKTSPVDGDLPREVTRDAHWVRPSLVGEVTFGEWTSDGNLRHPVWRGLRPDKKPEDVRIES
ncbi:ATP-dependent DNA ligase [Aeromicrobium terrae]|uniref:DNA ligase (ATP) n=1 Tax=Aeromicrobium terrae TaxID=2498846 RepID=A0A5C8NJ60_9ACTN|nr:ATP-dependent DNA ligase [Aeromicrobium terrae]TXL60925.1 ATP-dependent DNA ligase [Aeromicrobium terrae]